MFAIKRVTAGHLLKLIGPAEIKKVTSQILYQTLLIDS